MESKASLQQHLSVLTHARKKEAVCVTCIPFLCFRCYPLCLEHRVCPCVREGLCILWFFLFDHEQKKKEIRGCCILIFTWCDAKRIMLILCSHITRSSCIHASMRVQKAYFCMDCVLICFPILYSNVEDWSHPFYGKYTFSSSSDFLIITPQKSRTALCIGTSAAQLFNKSFFRSVVDLPAGLIEHQLFSLLSDPWFTWQTARDSISVDERKKAPMISKNNVASRVQPLFLSSFLLCSCCLHFLSSLSDALCSSKRAWRG